MASTLTACEIVEIAPSEDIFADPQHPDTEALLESVPRVSIAEQDREIETLGGDVPSPRNPPSGCRFRTRCLSVIQPAEVDIPQELYRRIISVRDRIRGRDIDVEGAKQYADSSDETVGKQLLDRLVDVDLSREPTHEDRVRGGLEAVVAGNWTDTEKQLARYESICKKGTPELQNSGDHLAACHLLDQPDEVETAVDETGLRPRQTSN